MSPSIVYDDWQFVSEEQPIILKSFPQFEVKLKSLPSFEIKAYGYNYSSTGMKLIVKRKNMGHLDSGYYYPTSSFAILSTISYLINPDVVRCTVTSKSLF